MGMFRSLAGMVSVELTSADVPGMLTAINSIGITILHTRKKDDLTVVMEISRADYRRLRALIMKRGESLRILSRSGVYWTFKGLLKRPVLIFGMTFLFLLMMYAPSRIFFVRVEGCDTVPALLIVEQAEKCGIHFGSSRARVRSEKVKNDLLNAIPELQWAAVNTSGCVATISVREKTPAAEAKPNYGVSSIIAVRDGIVTDCTATKGNLLCKTGQAVKAGEVLISGYTDCGLQIRATRADGEVYAQTQRQMTAVLPAGMEQKGEVQKVEQKYSLLFGKKRINFYKGSGISDTSCDKMYTQYFLTLPGGFRLPVALTVETLVFHDKMTVCAEQDAVLEDMGRYCERYLLDQMISGSIISRKRTVEASDEVYVLYEEYTCQEMIGRVKNEESIGGNGKGN